MATQSVTTQLATRGRRFNVNFRDARVGMPNCGAVYIAFAVQAAFPSGMPSVQQLCDRFGMSRATAYRYRAAMKAARGEH